MELLQYERALEGLCRAEDEDAEGVAEDVAGLLGYAKAVVKKKDEREEDPKQVRDHGGKTKQDHMRALVPAPGGA